jgi:murein L,D-transpeptidase YafK
MPRFLRDNASGERVSINRIAIALGLSLLLFSGPASDLRGSAGAAEKADRIEVQKAEHVMTLLRDGKVLKTYRVALSRVPAGPKEREGDHKVPEGQYVVDTKNPRSRFHLALHISYPNTRDREHTRKLDVRPGGNIGIHGLDSKLAWVGGLHRQVDWTDGCIAVTNSEIEEIWQVVSIGTPVEILP